MFFLWPLQMLLDHSDEDMKFHSLATGRTVSYQRDRQSSKSLKRFLKMLDILRCLSEIFGENLCTTMLITDKNKGFFRIPQLKSFLYSISRSLSDSDIAQLPIIINSDERFQKPRLALSHLGSELQRLYQLQMSDDNSAKCKGKREVEAEREIPFEGRKRRRENVSSVWFVVTLEVGHFEKYSLISSLSKFHLLNWANTAWFDGYGSTDLNTNCHMHQHMHHRLCWPKQAISTFTSPFTSPPSFRIFR